MELLRHNLVQASDACTFEVAALHGKDSASLEFARVTCQSSEPFLRIAGGALLTRVAEQGHAHL